MDYDFEIWFNNQKFVLKLLYTSLVQYPIYRSLRWNDFVDYIYDHSTGSLTKYGEEDDICDSPKKIQTRHNQRDD